MQTEMKSSTYSGKLHSWRKVTQPAIHPNLHSLDSSIFINFSSRSRSRTLSSYQMRLDGYRLVYLSSKSEEGTSRWGQQTSKRISFVLNSRIVRFLSWLAVVRCFSCFFGSEAVKWFLESSRDPSSSKQRLGSLNSSLWARDFHV